MPDLTEVISELGSKFGVLAESNTYQLTVIAFNTDVAVGDLFLLPSQRGADRVYIFRATQYANIFNRTLELNDVARNKLTMPDSYLAEDLFDETLIELKGIVLGYSEYDPTNDTWSFHKPRRLPQHLSDVYHVTPGQPGVGAIVQLLMNSQLGTQGLCIGELLVGERALTGVPVYLPIFALSHHIGVFGRTGVGKSNLMVRLLMEVFSHNKRIWRREETDPKASMLAIDPHDEFRLWHEPSGGASGIKGIVENYSEEERQALVAPFYYLTLKEVDPETLEHNIYLSRADITPDDLISIMEFSEQQVSFSQQYYGRYGERWITSLLMNEGTEASDDVDSENPANFLPGTISAVQRRLGGLRQGYTRLFTRFDPPRGRDYNSLLPDIVCALEQGRVLTVDTTLMTEIEQFLLTTIVARVLFSLRRALRSANDISDLEHEIRIALFNDDENGQIGMRALADELVDRLNHGELPYRDGDRLRSVDELPYVNVVVEEAPSVLNPQRMRFGSVFRDISRQGRKFGIGLTVVSQQVSEIDQGILTQLNTELNMALGNENERREAIRNASADLAGFERELQILGKGQVILTASYKEMPLPVQVSAIDN